MKTQSRRLERYGKGPGRLAVETPAGVAVRSGGGGVGVRDPLRAAGYMIGLMVGLVLLFVYILNDVPGLSPSVWRAQVSPYHPANGVVVEVGRSVWDTWDRTRIAKLFAFDTPRAHAQPTEGR